MLLAYSLTTAFLHACAYLRKHGRIIAAVSAFAIALGSVGGFVGYAFALSDRYNAEAEVLIVSLRESYETYQNGGSTEAALDAAIAQSELYDMYAGIYLPSTEQYSGSYAKLLEEFAYYDANVDDMIRRHHPAYEPSKRPAPFAYDTLAQKIATLKESVAMLLHSNPPEGEPFRLLLQIEERSDMLYADLIATLKSCYNDWIYQD